MQFLPTADPLDVEALEHAVEVEYELEGGGLVNTRVLSAEHIVAVATRTGRPKDFLRIDEFVEQEMVDLAKLKDILIRHKLMERWLEFCQKTGRSDPFEKVAAP